MTQQVASMPTVEDLRRIGLSAGLSALGVTTADVLEPARSLLPLRREAGLASAMQFTYRNPERSTDPARILPDARSMVVGLLDYRRTAPAGAPVVPRTSSGSSGGPVVAGSSSGSSGPSGAPVVSGRVARYSWRDFYADLRDGLAPVAAELEAAGYSARIVADSNALVDRNAAWRAGLGWYGKNTNLLVEGSGSWYVIGAVVTDAELAPAPEPLADGCGSCSVCIDECPTDALVAPGVLDARRCIAWLVQAAAPIPVEYRVAVGDWLYGCDICQEVCPPNRVTLRRGPAPAAEPGSTATVDVVSVLSASDEELLAEHGRWYIADRDPDVIRRTALVVLGNVAPPGNPVVADVLRPYLSHRSPLLRSHAVWAARRLGLDALAEATVDDPDPMVRAEWNGTVEARTVDA